MAAPTVAAATLDAAPPRAEQPLVELLHTALHTSVLHTLRSAQAGRPKLDGFHRRMHLADVEAAAHLFPSPGSYPSSRPGKEGECHSQAEIAMQLLGLVSQLLAPPQPKKTQERGAQAVASMTARGCQSACPTRSTGMQASEPASKTSEATVQTEHGEKCDIGLQTSEAEIGGESAMCAAGAGLQTASRSFLLDAASTALASSEHTGAVTMLSSGTQTDGIAHGDFRMCHPEATTFEDSTGDLAPYEASVAASSSAALVHPQMRLACMRCHRGIDQQVSAVCFSCFENKAIRCSRCLAVPVAFEGATCPDCTALADHAVKGVRRGGGYNVMKLPSPGAGMQLALAEAPVTSEALHDHSFSDDRFTLGTYSPKRPSSVRLANAQEDWIAAANGQRLYRVMLPAVPSPSPSRPSSRPSSAQRRANRRAQSQEPVEEVAAQIEALTRRVVGDRQRPPQVGPPNRAVSPHRERAVSPQGEHAKLTSTRPVAQAPAVEDATNADIANLRQWLAGRTSGASGNMSLASVHGRPEEAIFHRS